MKEVAITMNTIKVIILALSSSLILTHLFLNAFYFII